MSDDVITRAKASLGDYLSAPDTDRLIEDLIALAETQAAQLAAWADALNAADSILSLLHYHHNYARAEHSNVYVHDGEDLKMIEREEDMSGVFHINSGPKSRQVGFNCETELYNFLKDYANTFDMSVSSVIRRLILIGGYCENHHGHRSMPASYESVEETQGFDPKLFDDYDEKNPFEESNESDDE